MSTKAIALVVLLLASRVAAADDSMRCRGGVVAAGDREARVQERCGAPTRAESHEQTSTVIRGVVRHVTVDIWTYDRGPNELVRVLTFEDGVLKTIDVGGYGSGG